MSKCFITKLPSSVDNDNLPVLGQLRINWLKQSDLTDNDARAIELSTNDSITVKVSGAHLTDNTLSSNLGNSKTITKYNGLVRLYVSNDADAILTIDNKYSLTNISFIRPYKNGLKYSVKFDINDIRYCTALTHLDLHDTQVSGDVSGDISVISNLVNLQNLNLSSTQISGDISAISNLVNLQDLNLSSTQISGDISAISNLVNLQNIYINGTQISGDASKIPINVVYISQHNRKTTTNFTWTAKGRQNATLLAMEGEIPFDTVSMDNMLIDQATCTLNSSVKVISVSGTRTSASDAAVATLQNMGVTITGVTKQA